MRDTILSHLSGDYPWKDLLQYYPVTGSTNDVLKTLAKQGVPHGTAIVAGHQTGGHGRMGRSFHSPEGMGIYLSILLRPGCAPTELMHLTCAAAVAMCEAVEAAAGFRPGIKWTNDLVFEKRKLGGILTELGLSSQGTVDWAIIGIGINCLQQEADFPEEIRSIAASLSMVTGREIDRAKVAASMMEALHRMDSVLLSRKQDQRILILFQNIFPERSGFLIDFRENVPVFIPVFSEPQLGQQMGKQQCAHRADQKRQQAGAHQHKQETQNFTPGCDREEIAVTHGGEGYQGIPQCIGKALDRGIGGGRFCLYQQPEQQNIDRCRPQNPPEPGQTGFFVHPAHPISLQDRKIGSMASTFCLSRCL